MRAAKPVIISASFRFFFTALTAGIVCFAASNCLAQNKVKDTIRSTNSFFFKSYAPVFSKAPTKKNAVVQSNATTAAPIISYQTPQAYIINTAITPLQPTNAGGVVPATIYGQVSAVIASGYFSTLTGVASDASGNIVVADFDQNKIFSIGATGNVTTLAGSGNSGTIDGQGSAAQFYEPDALLSDGSGNIYVSDLGNNLIRVISATGSVSTLAGSGASGSANGTGRSASFNSPRGMCIDGSGNLYVADQGNNMIRKITPAGVVTTVAGSTQAGNTNGQAASATFNTPTAVCIDASGNLYVSDVGNLSIRKITPAGVVGTFASGFSFPRELRADGTGNIYVNDQTLNQIKVISPSGVVKTVAGTGSAGRANGAGNLATFNGPLGMLLRNDGYLYSAENQNADVRKIVITGYTIDKTLPTGLSFDPTTGIISGTPTTLSPLTAYTITAYNAGGSSSAVVNISVLVVSAPPTPAPPNISYTTPQIYTVNTPIAPLQPANTGGAVPATIYGQVTTFAGSGANGNANGTGTSASFSTPYGLTVDALNNIFVADYGNEMIREISPTAVVSTYAGNGATGMVNGAAGAASFNHPGGVVTDAQGNVYVGDQTNNAIREITNGGVVSTYSGGTGAGNTNGTLANATYNGPAGLTFDPNGNMYVADRNNNLVRKITPAGVVSSISGGFNNPTGVGSDLTGNIYLADQFDNSIKKISSSGVVSTLAGSGAVGNADGAGTVATFYKPFGLTASPAGVIYVADEYNNLIRTISSTTGIVATVAGNGTNASIDGNGKFASFAYPCGVALDNLGNLFVTDAGSSKIRKVVVTGYTIDKTLPSGLSFDPTTGIISGTPTVVSPATNYTVTAYNVGGSSSTIVNIEVTQPLLPSIITFPTLPKNSGSNYITPAATSTNPETPITYSSSNTAVAVITSGGLVQLVGRGVTTITASQAGDANYSPAQPVSQQMTVTEYVSINFPAIATQLTCNADFSANAAINDPTVPLTFSSSDPTVATISSTGVIHILKAGTTIITAAVSGVQYVADASMSQILTITPPPVLAAQINANYASICTGTAVTFTMSDVTPGTSFPANTQFQWSFNGAVVATNTSGTYTTVITSSNDVVSCIATPPASSCYTPLSASVTALNVTQYQTPSVVIVSSQTAPVCPGTAITYTATPTNGGSAPTYQWQVNGATQSATTAQFTSTTLNDGDLVSCTLTNTGGTCLTTNFATSNSIAAQIITIATPPTIAITASVNPAYFGTQVTFTATTANAGTSVDYQWQVNGNNVGTDDTTFTTSSLNNGDIVTCVMTAHLACQVFVTSNALNMIILPPLNVVVNNTFTPNSDGINDTWVIPALSTYPNCSVTVFNRYGTTIFQSKGYSIPWDGTGRNHEQIPSGVYYYIINPGNKTTPQVSGWVAIIR